MARPKPLTAAQREYLTRPEPTGPLFTVAARPDGTIALTYSSGAVEVYQPAGDRTDSYLFRYDGRLYCRVL